MLGLRLAMVCVVCYVVFHYVTHDAHHSQTQS